MSWWLLDFMSLAEKKISYTLYVYYCDKAGIFKFCGCSPRLAVSSRGPGDKNKIKK